MKSKLVALLMVSTLLLSGCSSKANAPADTATQATKETENPTQEEPDDGEDLSELDSIGDIKVEKELFDITITVPADFIGETTQEELDAKATEYGYKATLNEDGSATYVMTKSQHKKMLKDMTEGINEGLKEMIGSDEYPNITDVTANSNFTEFTVATKNTEPDMAESFSVMMFYMYGGMYGIFSGETPENVSVTFVNADTGDVISTANSSDMNQ